MEFIKAKLQRYATQDESTTAEPLLVTCTDYVLRMGGVFVNPKHKNLERFRVYIYVAFVCPILITFHCIHFATTTVSFSETVEILAFMDVSVVVWLMFVWIRSHRQRFVKCYQNILRDGEYVNNEFYQFARQQIIRKLLPVVIFVIGFINGLAFFPVLVAMFTDAKLGSPLTTMAPQHYPWDSSTISGYLFTFSLQILISLISVTVMLSLLFFMIIYWIVIKSHYMILDEKISLLDELEMSISQDVNCKKLAILRRSVMSKKQSDIIRYHQYIIRIINDFIHAVTALTNISIFSFYTINILLVFYLVFFGSNLLSDVKQLNMLIMLSIFFVMQCFIGEYITELNDNIKFQLYNTNWFSQSVLYKKKLNTFLLLLQKPFHVRFLGSQAINLPLLLRLVERIYSAIQLLSKTQNRQ